MLLLTLRGTPTIYYGDEIGMRDVPIPFEEVKDPQGINMPDKNLSRDPARTPMQWSNEENAGFTEGKPWLRLDKTFTRQNVQLEKESRYSILTFYRRLIMLRQSQPSLMYGSYRPCSADRQMIAFRREAEGSQAFLIVLNLTHRPSYYKQERLRGKIVLSTYPESEGNEVNDNIDLSGDEGVVVQLE
jgi:alpha-glucosidase